MAKLGWFVSTFTGLTRVDTKCQALALQDECIAAGKDPGVVLRECECGCGQPASKAVSGSRDDAFKRAAKASERGTVEWYEEQRRKGARIRAGTEPLPTNDEGQSSAGCPACGVSDCYLGPDGRCAR